MKPLRIVAALLSAFAVLPLASLLHEAHPPDDLWVVLACSWLALWAVFEVAAAHLGSAHLLGFPRLLTHLRYAPLAVLVVALGAIVTYDQGMILRSRFAIRGYVYGAHSPALPMPALNLHNDHRGWCGNGYSAELYALYGDTAAEAFDDADPAVRARSLRASIEVYDWLNGAEDGAFPPLLERAASDPDPLVRRLAAEYRTDAYDNGE